MAQIRNLLLEVEEGSLKSEAKISIQMDVDFSGTERRLSMQFGLFVGIYEGDYDQDMILPMSNGLTDGRIYNLDPKRTGSKNTQDDAIEVFYAGNLMPRRRRSIRVKLERVVRLKNRNVSKESFRVAAYVVPEISSGFAVSNEVRIEKEEEKSAKETKPTPVKKPVASKTTAQKKPAISPTTAGKKPPAKKKSPASASASLVSKPTVAKKTEVVKKPATKAPVAPKKAPAKKPAAPKTTTAPKKTTAVKKPAPVAKAPVAPKKTPAKKAPAPKTTTTSKTTAAKKPTTTPKKAPAKKAPAPKTTKAAPKKTSGTTGSKTSEAIKKDKES